MKKRTKRLTTSYRRLQHLALHLDNAREEERTRIARELHDEMGSTLTALKMHVQQLASSLPAEMTKTGEMAVQIDKLVTETIHTMRHVVSQLRPALLHEFGFAGAVENYIQNFQKQTGIECELVLPEKWLTSDNNQSLAIFRILQESLNNIAKHAQATKVSISFTMNDNSLSLEVNDNGVGFDRNAHKDNSFGLLGITERALMVNGRAKITSKLDKGTHIVVHIPLADIDQVRSDKRRGKRPSAAKKYQNK